MKEATISRTCNAPGLWGARRQEGSATLTAVMILGLLALFTAASLSRATNEAIVMNNDSTNTRSFYAAQASLELMSRNFNKIFDVRLNPTPTDLDRVRAQTPSIEGFEFDQDITQTGAGQTTTIEEGAFAGLVSLRDPWRLDATATYGNGAQVRLTRTFFNHRVPIFQFGIFYDDDMEFFPGPRFDFGGRVHSNRHIFMMASTGLYFRSRVTAAGEVVHDVARNGIPFNAKWNDNVFVARPGDTNPADFPRFTEGSVIGGPDIVGTDLNLPNGSLNANWGAFSSRFGGNLLARQRELRLPLQITSNSDPVELVKRGRSPGDYEVEVLGRAVDDAVLATSRYGNKPCIRVSLSDSRSRLPGGTGGVRLDGASDGLGGDADPPGSVTPAARGYRPVPMADGYQATRFNGHRLYTGASYTDHGMPASRQTWIKVELITIDESTLLPESVDVTADLLSLGFTEQGSQLGLNNDDRAVIKLQRFAIAGPPIKVPTSNINNTTATAAFTQRLDARDEGTPQEGTPRNVYTYVSSPGYSCVTSSNYYVAPEEMHHEVHAPTPGARVVPFPIKIYDPREGLYNDSLAATGTPSWASLYTGSNSSRIPVVGVLSMVDIDMTNLGRLIAGEFDGVFPPNASLPGGRLTSILIPDNGGEGWIVYVSDRRGDRDDDGEYDMEDIYGPNDGILQQGEDVNRDGVLQADYTWEAARYTESIETDLAAVLDHKYYRRGVRVIRGQTLVGTPQMGYAIASENGLYVLGSFNATGISAVSNPTQPNQYTGPQVPASLVADSVTILSREWNDGKSFRSPFAFGTRTVPAAGETTVRAAVLTGDPLTSLEANPHQGGGDPRLNGGVHNFKRFLENWGGTRLNYAGSLINLFNSRNNTAPFKCCNRIYSPPTRNWVFDTSFLDADRLPPGTPFFQFLQMTGFRQSLRQEE